MVSRTGLADEASSSNGDYLLLQAQLGYHDSLVLPPRQCNFNGQALVDKPAMSKVLSAFFILLLPSFITKNQHPLFSFNVTLR